MRKEKDQHNPNFPTYSSINMSLAKMIQRTWILQKSSQTIPYNKKSVTMEKLEKEEKRYRSRDGVNAKKINSDRDHIKPTQHNCYVDNQPHKHYS